ncbi:hypothetical protein [Streptomyces sp. NPDC127112]|uniref:hypothetical protein n=1 Tax=Streptomyces sp. NPDC127112 TaxID=3345364 RepID=UPI003642E800
MSTLHGILEQMTPQAREALLAHSHRVTFPGGRRAEKFWIIECGTVELDTHVPGRKDAVISRPSSPTGSTPPAPASSTCSPPHGSGTPLAHAR